MMIKDNGIRVITPAEAQSILDVACNDWQLKLANLWAMDIVRKKDIFISYKFYNQMREACTPTQHQLFDEIFGKTPIFKEGDKVIYLSNTRKKQDGKTEFTQNKMYILGGEYWDENSQLFKIIQDDNGIPNGLNSAKFRHATPTEIAEQETFLLGNYITHNQYGTSIITEAIRSTHENVSTVIQVEGWSKNRGVSERFLVPTQTSASCRLATPEEIKEYENSKPIPKGTPCLVKEQWGNWILRYADGQGAFYMGGKKEGDVNTWKEFRKLDLNDLP